MGVVQMRMADAAFALEKGVEKLLDARMTIARIM